MSNDTDRLYYSDSYRTAFRAHVVEGGDRAVLDKSAFYPTSGGQPHDVGRIAGRTVIEVVEDDDGRVVHVLSEPVMAGGEVECEIDWPRRFDHMQQHTGQHLLSAVFADLYSIETVSFHMGAVSSTIDLRCPSLTAEQITAAESRANAIIHENRVVSVRFEDAADAQGLRKASERRGVLRIIEISDLDRSACGGTHVRTTGEIGAILLRSTDRIRGNVRLEFLCGSRAVRRARADYAALESAARVFSSAIEEVPALVAAQAERLKEADKVRRRLEGELASHRGVALHGATEPDAKGIRIHTRVLPSGPLPDDLRAEAMAFVSGPRAVFFALSEKPASLLLAVSADSGLHAGNIVKELLAHIGGKGGGSAQMAQGSFSADPALVKERVSALLSAV